MRQRRPILASLWRHIFARRREEQDLEDELRSSVELLAEERIAAGQAPEAARRAARIELGGVTQIQEAVRDVRPGHLLEQLLQDARYAARGLAAAALLLAATGLLAALIPVRRALAVPPVVALRHDG